jgi:hypothetical protein
MQLLSNWPLLSQKRWVHHSGDGEFVAVVVDKIWPFAAFGKFMTEFNFMFYCFT